MANLLDSILEAESRRAKKVEQLIGLLRDPDLADIVAKLTRSGEQPALPFVKPAAGTPSNGNHAGNPGSLRSVILGLDLPQRFTAKDVLTRIEGKYQFTRANPIDAIRDVIYALSRPGKGQILRIAEKGGGFNAEQKYERVA